MPMEIVSNHEMPKGPWCRRTLQHPTADFVFEKVDGGHRQQKDVMQIGGDRCGQLVRSTHPRERNREQCFQRVEWRETEKHSYGRAKRDRKSTRLNSSHE